MFHKVCCNSAVVSGAGGKACDVLLVPNSDGGHTKEVKAAPSRTAEGNDEEGQNRRERGREMGDR